MRSREAKHSSRSDGCSQEVGSLLMLCRVRLPKKIAEIYLCPKLWVILRASSRQVLEIFHATILCPFCVRFVTKTGVIKGYRLFGDGAASERKSGEIPFVRATRNGRDSNPRYRLNTRITV